MPSQFVDSYEYSCRKTQLTNKQMVNDPALTSDYVVEYLPMFHEWATVQPGMICLSRKKKTAVFRQYVAAETAVPVIACAACLPKAEETNFFFAGVARSKSVRAPDDGIGPSVDEFFTLSIGGMVTVLNTSGRVLHPGDRTPARSHRNAVPQRISGMLLRGTRTRACRISRVQLLNGPSSARKTQPIQCRSA